eukprot:INCI3285.6.p1 GENE.INCI3285.6~~INCI3285.6.p1  ORF type:complete len:210 (-),score=36.96 INCI3285.6:228-857(-)
MFHYDLEAHLNTDMCGWDGGDCCPSTCRMPDESDCDNVVYDCLDPDADDSGVVSDCTASVPSWIGDGYCDNNMNDASSAYEYNNPACNWDGGDCCTDTCEAGLYDCSQGDFYCNDPSNVDFGTVNGQAVDNGGDDVFGGDNNSVLIGAIVGGVVVLVIIIVVVVVVVSRQKTRSTENRSSTYATHTSRPTTMIRAVEVDVDDTKPGFSQ